LAICHVRASDININFAQLFTGLDLSAGGDSGSGSGGDAACNATLLHDLVTLQENVDAALEASDNVDKLLYAADGSLKPGADIDFAGSIYNVFVDDPESWSGSVWRGGSMDKVVVPPGGGGFARWWDSYIWTNAHYTPADWELVSRAKSFDETTNLVRMITTAWASYTKIGDTSGKVYKVLETYNSFYRIVGDGEVRQTKLHYTQDGYEFAASWTD